MVDINLIGDDQTQFDNEDSEKEFQDTYSSDADELTQDSYMRSETINNADYAKVIRRGGSKAGVFILFLVVVGLLVVTAYLLFKPGRTQKIAQPEETPITQAEVSDSVVSEQPIDSQRLAISDTIIDVSPGVKEILVRSARDINVITQLVNSIPANVIFTLITYNDGNILLEVYAADKTDISDLDAIIRQNLAAADLKILAQDDRNIKGRKYFRALLSGNVNTSTVSFGSFPIRQPQYMFSDDFKNRINTMCQQYDLSVKQFDTGVEKIQGELASTPITFRSFGLKANIINLLQQIQNANLNVSYIKIAIITNDPELTSPYLTLVLNLKLYRPV